MDKSEFQLLMESDDISSKCDKEAMQKILRASYRPLQDELNKTGILNLIITVEEFGELQQQVVKYIRGRSDHNGLLEEVADAYLCLEYIKDICGLSEEEVQKAINIKLQRQDKRNDQKTF